MFIHSAIFTSVLLMEQLTATRRCWSDKLFFARHSDPLDSAPSSICWEHSGADFPISSVPRASRQRRKCGRRSSRDSFEIPEWRRWKCRRGNRTINSIRVVDPIVIRLDGRQNGNKRGSEVPPGMPLTYIRCQERFTGRTERGRMGQH